MPTDIKITTEMLFKGALLFALMDAICVPVLTWRVREETFHRIKWPLVLAAGLVWYGIWSWAIGNFWEAVYHYVFPGWAQTRLPYIAGVIAAMVTLALWTLAIRLKGKPALTYCLSGGVLGVLTHLWAVYRGNVTKPPMLQGASPLAAVVVAFFEYIFYWCTILVLAMEINWMWSRLARSAS